MSDKIRNIWSCKNFTSAHFIARNWGNGPGTLFGSSQSRAAMIDRVVIAHTPRKTIMPTRFLNKVYLPRISPLSLLTELGIGLLVASQSVPNEILNMSLSQHGENDLWLRKNALVFTVNVDDGWVCFPVLPKDFPSVLTICPLIGLYFTKSTSVRTDLSPLNHHFRIED